MRRIEWSGELKTAPERGRVSWNSCAAADSARQTARVRIRIRVLAFSLLSGAADARRARGQDNGRGIAGVVHDNMIMTIPSPHEHDEADRDGASARNSQDPPECALPVLCRLARRRRVDEIRLSD